MSESAPKSTIVIDVDAQGVTTGVNAAKKSLKGLGDSLGGFGEKFEDVGKQAEKGLDGIEKKVVATKRTTDALVNQLKNSIIDLKAAGDAASKYELRAIDKGIPASVYAPYVAQLRALQVEQAATAASALAASNSISKTITPAVEKVGMTAKATAAALRQVPAQFTDIVVSLQGGQAPLTVLLQQGGQLKDVFGGVGEAARAMGNYIKGLINPFTLTAAAVGTLYLAYSQGAAETEAFNKALILSGNQAGTTAVKLSAMAQSVSTATGATVGAAAEALAVLAGTSGIATAQFEKISAVAIGMEKTTGRAVAETVKQFVELGKSPVDASVKLNESTNYLTLSVYEQIKALTEQGRTLEAGVVAQNAYADAMSQRIPQLVENLGYAETAWKTIAGEAKKAWDNFLGIGRAADPVAEMSKNIAAAQAKLQMRQGEFNNAKGYDRVGTGADLAAQQKIVDGLLQEQDALLEIDRIKGRSNAADADRLAVVNAKAAFDKRGEAYLDKSAKLQRALNLEIEASRKLLDSGAISAAEYAKRLNDVQASFADKPKGPGRTPRVKAEIDEAAKGLALFNDLVAKSEGFTANYAEQMLSLSLAASKGALSLDDVAQAAAILNAQQPGAVAAAKALKDASAAADKYIDSLNKSADAVEGQLQKLQDEEEALLLSASANITLAEAIAEVEIARLREAQAAEMSYGNDVAAQAIQREIDARRELAQSINSKDAREAAKKAAEKAAEEWQKTADKINDTLTDALMRGFEDGKGFAENMRDTVVNMFKTMVLRPTISAIMQPVAQGIQGALGLGGSGGGASGTIGTASNLYSGFNALTGGLNTAGALGGLFASNAAYGAAIGTTSIAAGSQAAMLAAQTGTFGAAGVAATSSAAAGAGAGVSSMMATAGPYALAALAIYSLAKSMDDSGTYHSGGTGSYSADKGMGYGATSYSFGMGASEYRQDANQAAGQVAMAVSGIIDTAAGIAGSSAKSFVGTGYADDSSKDGAWGGLLIKLGDQLLTDWGRGGDKWPGREFSDGAAGQKEYLTAITTDVRKAIEGIGLPEWAQAYMDKLGDGAGLEQLAQALEQIKLTQAAFKGLGEVFTGLADLSDEAKTQLLKVSGGIEALAGMASAYYDNFYTSEEKAARLTGKTAEAFAELGLVMPAINDATRENYRALIDELAAKDLSIEANAKAYAGALSLQGAMDELAPAFKAVEQAAESTAAAMRAIASAQLDSAMQGADSAFEGVARAVQAQRSAITSAYESQSSAIQASLDAVSASVGKLQALSDALKNTLDGMRIGGSEASYRAAAQSQISAALATARSGGGLPVDGQLDSALRTVSQPSEQLFGSFEDYARDFYKTANDIAALGEITGVQLTAEQTTQAILNAQLTSLKAQYDNDIAALDETLNAAQQQLDALNGVDNSVQSIADAIKELAAAVMAATAIKDAQASASSYFDNNKDVADAYADKTYGLTPEEYAKVHYGKFGESEGRDSPVAESQASGKSYFELYPDVAAAYAASSLGLSQKEYSATHFANFGKDEKRIYPGFAQGINVVPYDMTARIHEGESVVPAQFNPYNPNATGKPDNAEMVAELRAMRAELSALKAATVQTAENTKATAKQLNYWDADGMPATTT